MGRRINVYLLDEVDEFLEQYKKDSGLRLDDAVNAIIKELKDILITREKKDGKREFK